MDFHPKAHREHRLQVIEEGAIEIREIVRSRQDPKDSWSELVTLATKAERVTAPKRKLYCRDCDIYLTAEWSWQ